MAERDNVYAVSDGPVSLDQAGNRSAGRRARGDLTRVYVDPCLSGRLGPPGMDHYPNDDTFATG